MVSQAQQAESSLQAERQALMSSWHLKHLCWEWSPEDLVLMGPINVSFTLQPGRPPTLLTGAFSTRS